MSYFTGDNDFSFEETNMPQTAVLECENCHTSNGLIEEIWTDDGTKPLLCEDCAAEVRRQEAIADQLVKLPSCDGRQKLIDQATSTTQLVNTLRAHDQACIICRPAKKFEPMQAALFSMQEVA